MRISAIPSHGFYLIPDAESTEEIPDGWFREA
jgi:hypothetical protein